MAGACPGHSRLPSLAAAQRSTPRRELLNVMLDRLRAGCAWRLLPHDLPPWKTVYHYFRC